MKVILLPQAQDDLGKIEEPLFSKIAYKLELLESFPQFGPALEGSFVDYRALTVGLFRVIYRIVKNQQIEVAFIRHCKRKPNAPLR